LEAAVAIRSRDEIADAICRLTDAQWARLRLVSRKYAWRNPFDADDLLQESFQRALAGSRQCPGDVDVVKFLCDAMKSISHVESEKPENRAKNLPLIGPGPKADGAIDLEDQNAVNVEKTLIGLEQNEEIRQAASALFPEDQEARDLIDAIAAGFEGEELRELTNLDEKTYASKRRLIRRTIDKHYPKGWKL